MIDKIRTELENYSIVKKNTIDRSIALEIVNNIDSFLNGKTSKIELLYKLEFAIVVLLDNYDRYRKLFKLLDKLFDVLFFDRS